MLQNLHQLDHDLTTAINQLVSGVADDLDAWHADAVDGGRTRVRDLAIAYVPVFLAGLLAGAGLLRAVLRCF